MVSVASSAAFCFLSVHDVSILFPFVVFCSVSGCPSVLLVVDHHQWGRTVSPPTHFFPHACVCVVHISPLLCCRPSYCLVLEWRECSVSGSSRVPSLPSILGFLPCPLPFPLNTCCLALQFYCSLRWRPLPVCRFVLVYLVSVVCSAYLEACFPLFASPRAVILYGCWCLF